MRKSERQYKEALKAYNRTAGQLKRHYDVNPVEYLEGVHTAKGVERALASLRREAERQQIERRVQIYEERTRPMRLFENRRRKIEQAQRPQFYINEEKQAAYDREVEAANKAYDAFNEHWSMSRPEYDRFVQFIGSMDDAMKENFGSGNLVEMFRAGERKNLSPTEIFEKVNTAYNMGGTYAEDYINNFHDLL